MTKPEHQNEDLAGLGLKEGDDHTQSIYSNLILYSVKLREKMQPAEKEYNWLIEKVMISD